MSGRDYLINGGTGPPSQPRRRKMRLWLLLIALVTVVLATVAATYWRVGSTQERFPRSSWLAVSLVSRTNGNVVIAVKNCGSQQFQMQDYVFVEYSDPASPDDYHPSEGYHFTGGSLRLSPGETLNVQFPVPPKRFNWRARVGGVGLREVSLKQALKRTWFFKHYPFVLHSEYGQTDWLPP